MRKALMLDLSRRLAVLSVAVAGLAGPALAGPALATARSTPRSGHKSRRSGHHKSHHRTPAVTRSCAAWDDSAMLTSYTNVSATNLTCTTVSSVEAKLVPKLASGSGPSGPVKESVSRITFKCVVALHLVPNRLTGSGKCTATNDRSFTFVATVSGQ